MKRLANFQLWLADFMGAKRGALTAVLTWQAFIAETLLLPL